MNIRQTLLAASIGALPLMASTALVAAPLMNGPVAAAPHTAAALVAQLTAQRNAHGLDKDHHFVLASQHPGVQGTQVSRVAHTYKGVKVFGSESVIVSDASGRILSESVAERRQYLGKGSSNKLGSATADFSVKPAIAPQEAIRVAVKSVAPTGVEVAPPKAELWIDDTSSGM